ncbi:MAG: UTP--glucose-1-phosphate uridylyltransferase [Candidatus Aminicenantales bacterium]
MVKPDRIKKAVIPAAGLGRRWLPITKAIPKEMLPVGCRPLVQYAWEEAVACGVRQIAIVVSSQKEPLLKYFQPDRGLEKWLKERGLDDLANEIRSLGRSARVQFIFQEKRLGLGHAVLMCREFVGHEPFALLNPDNIYFGERPCLSILLEAWKEGYRPVILLGKISKAETAKVGVASVEPAKRKGVYLVKDLQEKPGKEKALSHFGVWGRAILSPEIMNYLKRTGADETGEVQLTDGLRLLAKEKPLYGVLCPLRRYDAGELTGFVRANVAFLRRLKKDKSILA